MQRFLDAAFELIDEKGTTEFTIQEVVDQSKQSLRGFYEYFAGKDELLLALFEESIREAGDDIHAAVDTQTDPLERLRAFTIRLHEWCDPGEAPRKRGSHNRRAISEFSMHLAVNNSHRIRAALAPLSHLLRELIDAPRPPGRDPRRRHPARHRARAADGDEQLVRQPARRRPEAAPHRRGDLGILASAASAADEPQHPLHSNLSGAARDLTDGRRPSGELSAGSSRTRPTHRTIGDDARDREIYDRVGIDRLVVSDHVVFGERLDAYERPEVGGQRGGRNPPVPTGIGWSR